GKIAPRSSAFFLAAALFGAAVFATLRIDSVAADTARANRSNAAKNADSNVRTATSSAAHEPDQPDKPQGDAVGTIEGDAIALQGPMSVEVVNGQVKTMLRSGNDIRVKSGQAQIDLVEGGKIAICGPAHLSLLKSGGSLTIAIDNGVIHVFVEKAPPVVIYTPQIQAKPIAIGDGAEDALIGFDSKGVMCVRAEIGAIRLEHQLSGQSVIVPQGGDILLNNNSLEGISNTGGHCECEIQLAKETAPTPEVSRIATPEEIRQRDAAKAAEAAAMKEAADNAAMDKAAAEMEAADRAAAARAAAANKLAADQAIAQQKSTGQRAAPQQAPAAQSTAENTPAVSTPAANNVKPPVPWGESTAPPVEKKVVKIEASKGQEPVYQVFMPPLSFDARAAAPADNFDPKFIMLVRRVRVKPTLIFKGTVEGEAAKPVSTTAKVGPLPPANADVAKAQGQSNAKPAAPANDSVVNRVRNYLRRLFS
ncbi:MAG: hypothetical protein JO119_09840, partial [Acidobacteria bacterium]|nr:hypothetical protein [Acidobacteriota bacterium]